MWDSSFGLSDDLPCESRAKHFGDSEKSLT